MKRFWKCQNSLGGIWQLIIQRHNGGVSIRWLLFIKRASHQWRLWSKWPPFILQPESVHAVRPESSSHDNATDYPLGAPMPTLFKPERLDAAAKRCVTYSKMKTTAWKYVAQLLNFRLWVKKNPQMSNCGSFLTKCHPQKLHHASYWACLVCWQRILWVMLTSPASVGWACSRKPAQIWIYGRWKPWASPHLGHGHEWHIVVWHTGLSSGADHHPFWVPYDSPAIAGFAKTKINVFLTHLPLF